MLRQHAKYAGLYAKRHHAETACKYTGLYAERHHESIQASMLRQHEKYARLYAETARKVYRPLCWETAWKYIGLYAETACKYTGLYATTLCKYTSISLYAERHHASIQASMLRDIMQVYTGLYAETACKYTGLYAETARKVYRSLCWETARKYIGLCMRLFVAFIKIVAAKSTELLNLRSLSRGGLKVSTLVHKNSKRSPTLNFLHRIFCQIELILS
jgi:hypothetical protein